MFCAPAGAKYSFFTALVHGLISDQSKGCKGICEIKIHREACLLFLACFVIQENNYLTNIYLYVYVLEPMFFFYLGQA